MLLKMIKLALRPVTRATAPLRRAVIRKFDARIDHVLKIALEPTQAELRNLNEKMDRFLEISRNPGALKDFADQTETIRAIRAIQADCDLIREMNPMLNSVLRDLIRLQLQYEGLAQRLDDRLSSPDDASPPSTLPITGRVRFGDRAAPPIRSGKS